MSVQVKNNVYKIQNVYPMYAFGTLFYFSLTLGESSTTTTTTKNTSTPGIVFQQSNNIIPKFILSDLAYF